MAPTRARSNLFSLSIYPNIMNTPVPKEGDFIFIPGAEEDPEIATVSKRQPNAPAVYAVTDTEGKDREIKWDGADWIMAGKADLNAPGEDAELNQVADES